MCISGIGSRNLRFAIDFYSKFQYYIIINPTIVTIIHYWELDQASAADLCAWTWLCSKALPRNGGSVGEASDRRRCKLVSAEACTYSEKSR